MTDQIIAAMVKILRDESIYLIRTNNSNVDCYDLGQMLDRIAYNFEKLRHYVANAPSRETGCD